MSTHTSSSIVETEWLAQNLRDEDVVVLDGSKHLPNAGRDGAAEFLQKRIPGARYFDIDVIADTSDPLPHMVPSAKTFASHVGKMGISNTTRVIVYDAMGLQSAARVWWMFKIMGHSNVAILNGGLPKWTAEGNATEDGPHDPHPEVEFNAALQHDKVVSLENILAGLNSGDTRQIIDARAAGRFKGTAPEPRAEINSGRIPGSYNLPFNILLEEDKTIKSPEKIAIAFSNAGIDPDKPVITSCGSGVTAAILVLGLSLISDNQEVALFDGSWTQWGTAEGVPIEKD